MASSTTRTTDYLNEIATLEAGGGTPTLGLPTLMSLDDPLDAGTWLCIDATNGTAEIVTSDGTAVVPADGNVYSLTVE